MSSPRDSPLADGVLVFFARRTLDAEVAADLTAETFAQALASRHRFRDHGDGPAPWLGLRNDSRHPDGYGYAYATGWVGPRVARLTVRFQDGSADDVVLHGGYYLYVVPPANWRAGHRPSILEARAADGGLVSRQFLYPRQHCLYPGSDPVCNEVTATG